MDINHRLSLTLLIGAALVGVTAVVSGCESRADTVAGATVCTLPHDQTISLSKPVPPGHPDLTGHTRLGKASFYATSFAHREMADGERMDPQGDNAASRTLPLGTTAKVTNVKTGKSAIVSIEDRGPYVKGRIVDLSPETARRIGITRHVGVAEVKVAPIAVPLPDGTLKTGSGALHPAICRVVPS